MKIQEKLKEIDGEILKSKATLKKTNIAKAVVGALTVVSVGLLGWALLSPISPYLKLASIVPSVIGCFSLLKLQKKSEEKYYDIKVLSNRHHRLKHFLNSINEHETIYVDGYEVM